ncbi:beta-lactamase family protein [Aliifodinibius sp. S!AR15-10]|uniref:serine hydrolase domain-containing protein n=1 Tax=Aliifodinibius sp. S!AR15-10 TaxID=2950437 RepID=UPI00285812F3|nr:serine hydrolase domain-containing protein [Aliifodinibius sp. S!AR15-10]MDR8393948.1 beta-lactamase family protein [Aliifodinibius sp. S!AR15-10]
MYKLLVFSSFCLLLSVVATTQNFGVRQGTVTNFTSKIEDHVTGLMERYNIPGVGIALIEDGKLTWSSAYGYADIKQKRKMTVDAICRAESISKSVTALGVMKLVERGLVQLDAPVQKYLADWELPASEYRWEEVTIRGLLSNSAGMPLGTLGEEYGPQANMPTLREYLTKEALLAYEPGSGFLYSNAGFNLLELVIEEVTGRDFSEYMENEVLIPLGMHQSSYSWNDKWTANIPMGYDLNGQPVPAYIYPAKASGGLFSSLEDIARFVSAGMTADTADSPILNKKSIRNIYAPQVTTSGIFGFVADAYGLGHFIEALPDGTSAIWHGGQGHGWMTHFHAIPETGDGIVIFTNSQRSWPLIAQILSDWAVWNGMGPVKFSRINTVVDSLWFITDVIFLFALWHAGKIVYGITTGRRRGTLSLRVYSKQRVAEFLLSVIIIGFLLWAYNQNYLFITSIFPDGTSWLGRGLLLLSAVLLLSVLFPTYQKENLL